MQPRRGNVFQQPDSKQQTPSGVLRLVVAWGQYLENKLSWKTIGDRSHRLSLQSTTSGNTDYAMFGIVHQRGGDKKRLRHHICIKHAPARDPPVKPNQLHQETIRTLSLTYNSLKLQPTPHGLSTTPLLPVAYCSLYCSRFPKDTKQTLTHSTTKKIPLQFFTEKRLVCVILPSAATIYSIYLLQFFKPGQKLL